jgi:hypothetical protein
MLTISMQIIGAKITGFNKRAALMRTDDHISRQYSAHLAY